MPCTRHPPSIPRQEGRESRRTAALTIWSMSVGDTIRILLADGRDVAREALARYLAQEDDFIVLEPCRDSGRAVWSARQLQPRVVLLSLSIVGRDTFELAGAIQSVCPNAGVIFLGAEINDGDLAKALAAKGRGYLTRQSAFIRLPTAIREVAAGGVYFAEDVRQRLVIDGNGVRLAKP